MPGKSRPCAWLTWENLVYDFHLENPFARLVSRVVPRRIRGIWIPLETQGRWLNLDDDFVVGGTTVLDFLPEPRRRETRARAVGDLHVAVLRETVALEVPGELGAPFLDEELSHSLHHVLG
ncbi:MAG: hypothetical protein RBG13Loki_3824 [Promethearchaeota archaeon CR_4]|nr:MAG: hypothetical protein RBG13Loki_3824 [Candidatus Lokiarchaeota archaeon CR_4]